MRKNIRCPFDLLALMVLGIVTLIQFPLDVLASCVCAHFLIDVTVYIILGNSAFLCVVESDWITLRMIGRASRFVLFRFVSFLVLQTPKVHNY